MTSLFIEGIEIIVKDLSDKQYYKKTEKRFQGLCEFLNIRFVKYDYLIRILIVQVNFSDPKILFPIFPQIYPQFHPSQIFLMNNLAAES